MNEKDRIAFRLTQKEALAKYKGRKKKVPKPKLIDNEAKQIAGVWKEKRAYYKEKYSELE